MKNEAIRMISLGESSYKVAKKLGVDPRTVRRWCKSEGVELDHKNKHDQETVAKAMEMVDNGLSYNRVAAILGISNRTVYNWNKKRGEK